MAVMGQKPLMNKKRTAAALIQKTEKSKYSLIPLQTPNMTPFRER